MLNQKETCVARRACRCHQPQHLEQTTQDWTQIAIQPAKLAKMINLVEDKVLDGLIKIL